MADSLQTLADLAKINDLNARDAGATEVFNAAPMLAALHAIESTNGATHTYTKYTGAPVVGFRKANAGRDHSKSADALVTLALEILDASFNVDKMIAEANKKLGVSGHMAREAYRHLKQAFRVGEEQMIYGTDDDGFTGLVDSYAYTDSPHVVNAAGGASGDRTSVWAIRTVPDESGVCAVLGSGEIQISEYFMQMLSDGYGKKYPAYVQPIDGWLGMQVATANCVARLVNVGGTKPLDDKMLSDLLEEFEEEAPATHIVMNRHARGQLRNSRTATNATGANAPLPTEFDGVPIITTSSIKKNEDAVIADPS